MSRSLKDEIGIRWNTLCFIYRHGDVKAARFAVMTKHQDSVVLLCDYINYEVSNAVLVKLGVNPSVLEFGDKLEFTIDGYFTGRVVKCDHGRSSPSQPKLME